MRNHAVLVFGPDHNFGVIKDWIVTETFHKLENMESFFSCRKTFKCLLESQNIFG